MSLFDVDSSCSFSDAPSSSSDEGTLPTCPPPPPLATYDSLPSVAKSGTIASCAAPLSALEQRRHMAQLDAARQRNRGVLWRNELLGSPAVDLKGVIAGASSVQVERTYATSDPGKFGNSIAAALNLRREEREKALLKRLQQQRKAEEEGSDGQALAEKDTEVGVFVTAAYKALLRRNLHPAGRNICDQGAQLPTKANYDDGEGSDEDNDGPLGVYLRQLEGTVHPATHTNSAPPSASQLTTGDYYECIMKAPLLEEKNASGTAVAVARSGGSAGDGTEALPAVALSMEGSDLTSLTAPTLRETQDLIKHRAAGSSSTPGSLNVPQTNVEETKGDVKPSVATEGEADDVHSAVLTHARLLFDARQSKNYRGVNHATLVAAARRCDERIGTSLFASLS
ncbi:hypothetical_protein [Leishmania braziliensis MHOM/BR/75/M2904]|uniref:Hypothetical_protein n=1 Tax=Leishmania braziliensis MHOM/BR/75/M2904 TaxID=420245 RepID=A0A3P3ZFW9_LEIBR|nr:unnamed protein product [Leishmania braziliensis]SYZ69017.1 hypothetical_protein [Leishmania braziliensis MHOM/BR/75/M2904]